MGTNSGINKNTKGLRIGRLQSGGLMTNYYCTSRCKHCLYSCSPRWARVYIDKTTTRRNFEAIKNLGCRSVHVGGGEPFLDAGGLKDVLAVAQETGMGVAYVETNSSWYRDLDTAVVLLKELKTLGLSTLLVSISPFHNEYIPFCKVKGVFAACREAGLSVFQWIKDFYSEIDTFDDNDVHELAEYERRFGDGYLASIPSRYWVHLGGRALKTFQHVLRTRDIQTLLADNPHGCSELQNTSHFHMDLFGNYIPSLCAGLAIQREDLGRELSADQYPLLSRLYSGGIGALFDFACREHGYDSNDRFLSKCHLCFDIRRHLALNAGWESKDLQPLGCYQYQ